MHAIFAALVLLLVPAPATARTAVQLTLKADALVAGARVTLADVAAPAGDEVLATVDLGNAPLPGYTARLTRAEIERVLRSRALPYQLAPGGAAAVKIERRTQACDHRALGALAQEHLRRHLAGAQRVELQLAAPLPDLQLAAGAVQLMPRPLAADTVPRSRMTVWVDVLVDGAPARSVSVTFQVRAYRKVLVAARALTAGAQPQCDSLATREEDVAALDGPALEADCTAVRGRLKRTLAQGAPLLKSHLEVALAVAQGDSVGLQMRDGAIVLESRATALSGGDVGQRIDVRPSGAAHTVRAEIAGPGLVKIY